MCKKNNRSLGLYSVATARGILLFLICIFLNEAALNQASLDPSVKETSFSYPSFDADSCNSTLICRGSVSVGDRSLKLTPEPLPVDSNSTQPVLKDQIGRVLFHHPVIAWLSYINTTFTVRIFAFPNTATNGDGMAFIMAQNNSPSPPDSEGSYLGVLDKSTEGNPLVSFLNQSIDMSKWVPNSVYVGFSAATGPFAEAHEVLNWTFQDLRKRKERSKRRAEVESRSMRAANAPKMFTYRQLSKATLKFSRENLLGTGGFGSVYKEQIFLNPDEPLMEVPEWRPNAFFVPLSSSASTTRSATDFGSKSDDDVLLQSTPEEMVLDEIVVHHEDSDI
ncbi:hypothetical protein D5086_031557 [Populus alba]|uniref:Uncharacterized protein n=1 Tax=Populus alba TaxID=43335 RepID=A0ACC4AIZ1_POPAL